MGSFKNKYYIILPVVAVLFAILFQGLFTTLSAVICALMIISFKDKRLTLIEIISLVLVLIGFIISDITNRDDSLFLSGFVKPMLLFIPIMATDKRQKKTLSNALYWGINISSLTGIIAYFMRSSFLEMTEQIDGRLHIQGVYGYSNVMAVICAVGIIFALYYIKSDKNKAFVHEIMLCINTICLFLTYSMLTVATLLVVLLFGLSVKYRKLRIITSIAVGVGIVALVTIIATGNDDIIIGSTLACRLIYWYDAFGMIVKNPLGIGVDTWNNVQYSIQSAQYSVRYVHNGFLQLALDGGIIALVGIVLIIVSKMIGIIKEYRRTTDNKPLYVLMAIGVIIIHAFVDIDMTYGAIWFILGILLAYAPKQKIIFKNNTIISIVVICISACTLFTNNITIDKLQVMSNEFSVCVNNDDLESAYNISKSMIEYAPRQQISYDAHHFVLSRQENNEEIKDLIDKVKSVNRSMNPLSEFMSEHKKIILPIGGGVK